jgi:predicted O-methyltransferase YrrM
VTAELLTPAFNGWMLPADALAILTDLIAERRPALILEAGSGRSTVILAAKLRELGCGRLVSLEHRPDFWESTDELLRANGLTDVAEVRLAELEDHGRGGLLAPQWYESDAWADLDAIEMLIVDGPPGHLAEFARDPALPLLHDRLADGAVVVLDDTYRPQEQAIVAHWQGAWGLSLVATAKHSTGALTYGTVAA